jgi:hypothetical protein
VGTKAFRKAIKFLLPLKYIVGPPIRCADRLGGEEEEKGMCVCSLTLLATSSFADLRKELFICLDGNLAATGIKISFYFTKQNK